MLSYSNPTEDINKTMDQLPRLILLRNTIEEDEDSEAEHKVDLCKFALRTLCILMNLKLERRLEIQVRSRYSIYLKKCAQILAIDKSNSLTEAKQILEFGFFAQNQNFETDFQAKLWLDESRAQCVNQTVSLMIFLQLNHVLKFDSKINDINSI